MKLYALTTEKIEKRIEELAKHYTPEWHFDRENPDIGTTIAKLFAVQMKENADMADNMLERYHTEFVNMTDISQKPAKAAGSLVSFSLVEDTIPGVFVRKGTRVIADPDMGETNAVYFETDREIYVTGAEIIDAFMTDREDGTLVPLLGEFSTDPLIDGTAVFDGDDEDDEAFAGFAASEEEEPSEPERIRTRQIKPFVLFSESASISKSALVLYHDYMFDIENEPIYIRISGNTDFNQKILSGEYHFCYYSKQGLSDFDSIELLEDNETFILKKSLKNRRFQSGGREYSAVVLKKLSSQRREIEVKEITISSSGTKRPADYVDDGMTEMDTESFAPFSDILAVYNECYIGHDLYFSKAGAKITICFQVTYPERYLYLTKQQEEESLKIIKRKPKVLPSDIASEAYADEISLEYFNGSGFKKLRFSSDMTRIFSDGKATKLSFSFVCPSDWEPTQSGAFLGRAIRMRLLRSDNCFLRPCVHHYPLIKGFRVDFTYESLKVMPKKLQILAGTKRRDITADMRGEESFTVISNGEYSDDALYLGFDRKLENGPVSLYFELEDVVHQTGLSCIWEYSTGDGFRRMKVLDQTASFQKSGAVMFIPPPDMVQSILEHKKRYWLRIRRAYVQDENESSLLLPRIRRILLNVVGVTNVITSPEENYYLSEIRPFQRVYLSSGNILEAEVWVNETGMLSNEEVERLLLENPDIIRAERDILGGFSEVFIRWEETESFLHAKERRVYELDRMTGEIVFSDGIRADMPAVTDNVSFKVRLKTTNGSEGNIGENRISEMADTFLYLDRVTNPVRAYGGKDMETVEEALKRGANIISGRRRLVTAHDFIWDILNYSDSIAKAVCIPGEFIDGVKDVSVLSIVLLMRDHMGGSFSFQRVAPGLKEELLKKSLATISPERLQIVEPVFVTVTVNVWAEILEIDENFEVQNLIRSTLVSYLDPVNGNGGEGFEIGSIPRSSQIVMRLSALKNHALMRKLQITAHYADRDGEHETDLDRLTVTPFMTVRSGDHQVHIVVKE